MYHMDVINSRKTNHSHVRISAVLLAVIVALTFLAHLFSYTFSSGFYIALLLVLSCIYVFRRKKITVPKSWLCFIWFAAVLVAGISLLRSSRSANAVIDVSSLFCCMLLVLFFSRDCKDYSISLRVITFMGGFFACGILLQRFFPGLYDDLLDLFPTRYAEVVREGAEDLVSSSKRGFAINSGFAAGYICSGVIALISLGERNSRKKTKTIVLCLFLVLALLFTGKRGQSLFLILSLLLRFVLPEHGTKRMQRYWILFVLLLSLALVYGFFGTILATIPLIKRFMETVNGVIAGDDVSSLRLPLYRWAITLFKQHPFLGIGWGEYRSTVAGVVSFKKALDVHNIYLQLLCETGIVGFSVFAILFSSFWIFTRNAFCQCTLDHSLQTSGWLPLLSFSFTFQSFFLLYGLTGNDLYDQHFQLLYALSCGIAMAYRYSLKTRSDDIRVLGGKI